jgi:hypothetical protein
MIDSLRPFIARYIALAIAWLVAHYAIKFGVSVDNQAQQALANEVVNIVCEIIGIYAGSHKALNKIFNPGDAASSHLAADEKRETESLKRGFRKL